MNSFSRNVRGTVYGLKPITTVSSITNETGKRAVTQQINPRLFSIAHNWPEESAGIKTRTTVENFQSRGVNYRSDIR